MILPSPPFPFRKEFQWPLRHVAVVVGSLRKESFNRKLAKALVAMAPAPLSLEIVEIGQLPLYNQDDDASAAGALGRLQAAGRERRRGAVRHAGIQPLGARRAEERDRHRLAARTARAPGTASRPRWSRLARRDRRVRREPPPAPVARVPEHAGAAAARGLRRRRRRPVRRAAGAIKKPETPRQFLEKFLAAFAHWIERTARRPPDPTAR